MNELNRLREALTGADQDDLAEALLDVLDLMEDKNKDVAMKIDCLHLLVTNFDRISIPRKVTTVFIIGKYQNELAVAGRTALRDLAQTIITLNDAEIGWQYLLAYMNLVGDVMDPVDISVFNWLKSVDDRGQNISHILPSMLLRNSLAPYS
jgi:hypothetical protein